MGGASVGAACNVASQCPGGSCQSKVGGTPEECIVGKFRDCFLDNGVVGGSVTVSGVPYPKCGDSGTGTIGALFCIPPTSAGSVNATSGLPGLGRVTLPYTATFFP